MFEVFVGAPATFEKVVIRAGSATGLNGYGGGIRSYANMTLISSTVAGNRALGCGGGLHVQSGGRLVLRNTTVTRNRADGDGGGISASCFGDSGAVSIRNSTGLANRADADGNGVGRGGGIYLQSSSGVQPRSSAARSRSTARAARAAGSTPTSASLRLDSSTISGNIARLGGGGVSADGVEPLLVVNSTVSGNRSASSGGGIYADGSSVVRLNAVSVVRNRANTDGVLSEAGGGLFADLPAGDFVVLNSLVALNTVTDIVPGNPPIKNDCSSDSPFTSQGHNLLSTRFFCDGFSQPTDRARTNPKLGTLGNHGGPTKTVPLLAKSPALNRAGGSAPSRDQRGVKRRDPDIGAYERR